jgi:transcriptional regulator with XRE-family HTH domain
MTQDNNKEAAAAARAKRLRERISAKGFTLAEFARQANVTRNVMYGLGKGRVPTASEKARIDDVLGSE